MSTTLASLKIPDRVAPAMERSARPESRDGSGGLFGRLEATERASIERSGRLSASEPRDAPDAPELTAARDAEARHQAAGEPASSRSVDRGHGFTKDELSSRLERMQNADNGRGRRLSDLLTNFDAADTNGDGRLTAREAAEFLRTHRQSAPVPPSAPSGASMPTATRRGKTPLLSCQSPREVTLQ